MSNLQLDCLLKPDPCCTGPEYPALCAEMAAFMSMQSCYKIGLRHTVSSVVIRCLRDENIIRHGGVLAAEPMLHHADVIHAGGYGQTKLPENELFSVTLHHVLYGRTA